MGVAIKAMRKVAKLSAKDREALFRNTAAKIGMSEGIVEKDFWVCFILDYLFHESPWRDHLVFKGGTSLSKAYHLIKRFSEDVDLILDWRVLGYAKDYPLGLSSNNQREKFKAECTEKFRKFLADDFIPKISEDIGGILPKSSKFSLYEENGELTVLFHYPSIFRDFALTPAIRLEIGPLAAWTPTQNALITPYVAECYSGLFAGVGTVILTTTAERSFWEKATILHAEAHRPDGNRTPQRYSRHYYDMYCMAKSPFKKSALDNIQLLKDVAEFKNKFYHAGWARYDMAKPGTLRLVPSADNEEVLRKDYDAMQSMFYGEYPDFNTITDEIAKLEKEVNGLK